MSRSQSSQNSSEEIPPFYWISSWTTSASSPWLCFAASTLFSESLFSNLYCIRFSDRILIPYTFGDSLNIFPLFSPDAQWILFSSRRTSQTQLHLMRTSGGESCPLLAPNQSLLAPFYWWSPEGNKILVTIAQQETYCLGWIDFWTRQWIPLLDPLPVPPLQPQMSSCGQILYYWIPESPDETSCWSFNLATQQRQKLFSVPEILVAWSISPHKKFAVVTSSPHPLQWQISTGNGQQWQKRKIPAPFSVDDPLLMAQLGSALGLPVWSLDENAIFYTILEQQILKLGKISVNPAQPLQILSGGADVVHFSSPKPDLLFYYQLGMEDLGSFREYEVREKTNPILFRFNETRSEKKQELATAFSIFLTRFQSIFQALNIYERNRSL